MLFDLSESDFLECVCHLQGIDFNWFVAIWVEMGEGKQIQISEHKCICILDTFANCFLLPDFHKFGLVQHADWSFEQLSMGTEWCHPSVGFPQEGPEISGTTGVKRFKVLYPR